MPPPRIEPASPTTNPLIVWNPPGTNNEAFIAIRSIASAVFVADPNGSLSLACILDAGESISVFFDNQADFTSFHDIFLPIWTDLIG